MYQWTGIHPHSGPPHTHRFRRLSLYINRQSWRLLRTIWQALGRQFRPLFHDQYSHDQLLDCHCCFNHFYHLKSLESDKFQWSHSLFIESRPQWARDKAISRFINVAACRFKHLKNIHQIFSVTDNVFSLIFFFNRPKETFWNNHQTSSIFATSGGGGSAGFTSSR